MTHLAWRAQPPDESSDEPAGRTDEDAEVVDLGEQRLLGWLKGMFGGGKKPEPPHDDG